MALPAVRSGLKNFPPFRGTILRGSSVSNPHRKFSSSAHHDNLHETGKWEKITYAGIATCAVLAFYNFSKGHLHQESPPPYPYLHIRNKEFPWGPDGLFERKHVLH